MPRAKDPTQSIRTRAAKFADVDVGDACTQSAFKIGKQSFLYIGPGPKGEGFKAMFRLGDSLDRARDLADEDPDRFQVGKTGYVTARFTAEKPLPKKIWEPWLKESYALARSKTKR